MYLDRQRTSAFHPLSFPSCNFDKASLCITHPSTHLTHFDFFNALGLGGVFFLIFNFVISKFGKQFIMCTFFKKNIFSKLSPFSFPEK
jgi:hypothetical protein